MDEGVPNRREGEGVRRRRRAETPEPFFRIFYTRNSPPRIHPSVLVLPFPSYWDSDEGQQSGNNSELEGQ